LIGKKLLNLLKALSPTEFRRLRKLCQSPIYTNNADHLKFYDFLRKHYPDFDSPKLQKEVVFKKIWTTEKFDNWKLRNLFREFTRLTESYFLLLAQENNKLEREKQLVHIYGQRNIFDFFEKGTKGLLADLEALPYRDKAYYLQKAQLLEGLYFHPLKEKYDLRDKTFETATNSMDQYFMFTKIQQGIASKSLQNILNKPCSLRFLDLLKSENVEALLETNPLLQLQYQSYQLLVKPDSIDIEAYELLFFNQLHQLRAADQQTLFFNALNFLMGQANKNPKKFNSIIFRWYKKGLDQQLVMKEGSFDTPHFTNIITYACLAKEFDWAWQFIQNYQKWLDTENAAGVLSFNLAKWHYFQKEFEQSLALLTNCSLPKAYNLTLKNLEIRVIFELFLIDYSYHKLLFAKIKTFEAYLRRTTKFTPLKKTPYFNYLSVIYKLTNCLMHQKTVTQIQYQLLPQLNESANIIGKQWLLEKVEGLA